MRRRRQRERKRLAFFFKSNRFKCGAAIGATSRRKTAPFYHQEMHIDLLDDVGERAGVSTSKAESDRRRLISHPNPQGFFFFAEDGETSASLLACLSSLLSLLLFLSHTHLSRTTLPPSKQTQITNLVLSPFSRRPDVSRLDISADLDDDVPVPNLAGKPVPASSRKFLDFAPPWTTWPDYDRVLFVNSIVRTLWPYYNAAIGKIAVDATVPIFKDICAKVPAGLLQAIDIERLSLGRHPLAIGGIKAYHTKDDSCVFEAPLQWGSALRVRVSVRLKFGPFVVHVPLEVGDVQVRAVARISLRPLVEELPCLGGAEVSLLGLPHYDLSLRLVNRLDLMRVPGLKAVVDAVVAKVVGDMLLYPNKFSVDLMPGGGLPPPPLGMVEVRIERVDKITDGGSLLSKVDPYVEVQCRKGRVTRTRTIYNCDAPVFEETIAAIVDDPDTQCLNVNLYDDCGGYNDKVREFFFFFFFSFFSFFFPELNLDQKMKKKSKIS